MAKTFIPPRGTPKVKSANEQVEDQRYYWYIQKDPLSPWKAILLCIENNIPIPDWILLYLGELSSQFLGYVRKSPKRYTPAEVSKALGFDYGRPFTRWRVSNRNYNLFINYQDIRLKSKSQGEALKKLGDETGTPVANLRRYLNSFARLFTTGGLDDLVSIQLNYQDIRLKRNSQGEALKKLGDETETPVAYLRYLNSFDDPVSIQQESCLDIVPHSLVDDLIVNYNSQSNPLSHHKENWSTMPLKYYDFVFEHNGRQILVVCTPPRVGQRDRYLLRRWAEMLSAAKAR